MSVASVPLLPLGLLQLIPVVVKIGSPLVDLCTQAGGIGHGYLSWPAIVSIIRAFPRSLSVA
jgi:hypothetical protein